MKALRFLCIILLACAIAAAALGILAMAHSDKALFGSLPSRQFAIALLAGVAALYPLFRGTVLWQKRGRMLPGIAAVAASLFCVDGAVALWPRLGASALVTVYMAFWAVSLLAVAAYLLLLFTVSPPGAQ